MNSSRRSNFLSSRAKQADSSLHSRSEFRPVQSRALSSRSAGGGRRSLQRGFTLIELLIVISIILILVGIAAGNYQRHIIRVRETVLKSDLQEMRKAIDNFTLDKQ